MQKHLPISWEECQLLGWDFLDILLVTGDAYIDHPSFGVALIGRYLEHHGYRVAILSQPRYDSPIDFKQFPTPRLFCGITAGNLDSIVANYSGNGKVRDTDAFSPAGSPWRSSDKNKNNRYRPDRASLIYSNLARSTYKDCPIILGGIEASLRRFVHYDYKQGKLRASILTDAKADLLVYGMGEHAILDISKRIESKQPLTGIRGTCERLTEKQFVSRQDDLFTESDRNITSPVQLPSIQEIEKDNSLFLEAELTIDKFCKNDSPRPLLQKQQSHWILQHPPAPVLNSSELDHLYSLPFTRTPHPSTPDIPAYRMIKDSVTIVRGCSGNCSFCAITRHQGAKVESRSIKSIVEECRTISSDNSFRGTISDLGGPTANLFATKCAIGTCKKKDCLYPKICKHLQIDEEKFLELLEKVQNVPGIKNVFISSGLRMELLLNTPRLLRKIVKKHTPGALKIAPEHACDDILQLMHKESHNLLKRFIDVCKKEEKKVGKKLHLTPYVISAHPGSTKEHAQRLANNMKQLGLRISKFQDFTPTPGTISTAMYVAGKDPITKKSLFVPKNSKQRTEQRQIIEETFALNKKTKKSHKQPSKTATMRKPKRK